MPLDAVLKMSEKSKKVLVVKWVPPATEEIRAVIDLFGETESAINHAAEVLKKPHRKTVWRWYHGEGKIDYANWKLLNEEAELK